MTRSRTVRWTPAVLSTLAVLLAACSAESASSDSPAAGDPDSAAPTERSSSVIFDPNEPTLPGGVRVLSQDVDGFVQVEAGRHAVRVSKSLLYQFDLPEDSEVYGGLFVNPGRDVGGDTIVYLYPTDMRMGLPAHPCRDHTLGVVGPTVGDLATALSRQPYLQVTKPVEVTVGGMDGLFVKATVPDDAEIAKCQDDAVFITSEDDQGSGVGEPGLVDRMWILDIDGARHILLGRTFGDTKLDTRLVTRLVQSITFTRG